MKKLSDFSDGDALDLLAEITEPAVSIFSDPNFLSALKGDNKISAVRIAISDHKHAVMKILAAMEGVPLEQYHCNFFTLPIRLIEIINEVSEEPELLTFFVPQSEKKSSTSSGSVTANTGD